MGKECVLRACGVHGPAVSCDCRALDKVECLVQVGSASLLEFLHPWYLRYLEITVPHMWSFRMSMYVLSTGWFLFSFLAE